MKRFARSVQVGLLISLVGLIFIQPLWADSGPDHQQSQSRPIMLGVSGGPIDDLTTKLFGTVVCCVGTLGGLVTNGNSYFILSNNHVLAGTNSGVIGDEIVQPGLADVGCAQNPGDVVANLSDFEPIDFSASNLIDAAIAEIVLGQVDMSGSILDIGQPGSTPVTAEIGMNVKKSGRTTGLTHGTIEAVNVTISVSYPKGGRCGAFFQQNATFTNQISIVGTSGSFSAGGDSGSLIVEDADSCPRSVGLLFAGNETVTIANPIDNVFDTFGVTGVGCAAATSTLTAELGEEKNALSIERPRADKKAIAAAIGVQERHNPNLLSIAGVVGTGVGLSRETDEVIIEIYVEKQTPDLERLLPRILEGITVKMVETGKIYAY